MKTHFVCDGMALHRKATRSEIKRAVPLKTRHCLTSHDVLELTDGTFLRSWGDGRYSENQWDYVRVYFTEDDECHTIGYLRRDKLDV